MSGDARRKYLRISSQVHEAHLWSAASCEGYLASGADTLALIVESVQDMPEVFKSIAASERVVLQLGSRQSS